MARDEGKEGGREHKRENSSSQTKGGEKEKEKERERERERRERREREKERGSQKVKDQTNVLDVPHSMYYWEILHHL